MSLSSNSSRIADQLEAIIRRDPGGRGLASFRDEQGAPLLVGHLAEAAERFRLPGRTQIVTGFCVETADGVVTAETDGPPGAVYLAGMLASLGGRPAIVTDGYAAPLVSAGLRAAGLPAEILVEMPQRANDVESRRQIGAWRAEVTRGSLPILEQVRNVVSIERVGPNHTPQSIAAQFPVRESEVMTKLRMSLPESHCHVPQKIAAAVAEFESLVPEPERNRCFNMRGRTLDAHTAPLHTLFAFDEEPRRDEERTLPHTVGIVDGGNEIGSGNIPWSTLRRAIAIGPGEKTACRIRTDRTIVAGVSNWGAYALVALLAVRWGDRGFLKNWRADDQRGVIEAMVRDGGGVDGVTKRREATVDGIALEDYLAVFDEIRRLALC